MLYLAYSLFGLITALWVHNYIQHFVEKINDSVYENYEELFLSGKMNDSNLSSLILKQNLISQSTLKTKKCGHFFYYLCSFIFLSNLCFSLLAQPIIAIWMNIYICILIVISILDWLYQMIPPNLCQNLFILGLLGAYFNISPLTLEESFISSLFGFSCFYIIYYIAKWYYKSEALGRGDYWLMLGLGSISYYQTLPKLVFIACLLALIYWSWEHYQGSRMTQIPFGPFLILATGLLFLSQ